MKNCMAFLIVLLILLSAFFIPLRAYAQEVVLYSFVRFDSSYDEILSSAKNEGYEVQESELSSPFGKYLIKLEKPMSYYNEQMYLFFDQNKKLQFFTVKFLLGENQSRVLLDRLATSIVERLSEKYGNSDPGAMLYQKVIEGRYEIVVPPIYAGSRGLEVSFKDTETYSGFQRFYEDELKAKEDEEIANIIEKF